MKHRVETTWKQQMEFDAQVSGKAIPMDATEENGGHGKGSSPKELMLAALGGCTSMDVIAILRKMQLIPEAFEVVVEAEVTEEHPKHYYAMHLTYIFTGKQLDEEKLKRAIQLSQEKYCGVYAVYAKTMQMTSEIKLIEI